MSKASKTNSESAGEKRDLTKDDKKKSFDEHGLKKLLAVCTLILFAFQLVIVKSIFFLVGWDLQTLRGLASKAVLGTEYDSFYDPYLQVNPNNIWMYCYNKIAFQAGRIFGVNGYCFLVAAGVIVAAVTVYVTGICAYRLTENVRLTIIIYGFTAVFFGLSPWISVPYSDVFAAIVPIIVLTEYNDLIKQRGNKKLKLFIMFAVGLSGYFLKPISCIPLIAIVIEEILHLKKPTRDGIMKTLVAFTLSFICVVAFNQGFEKYAGYVKDESIEKPMTHYLMMGLNTESCGGYTFADDDYTSNVKGIKAKEKANLKKIEERLNDMGFDGFSEHLKNKTLMNFNTGILGWGKEINFAANDVGDMWAGSGVLANLLKNFYYVKGIKYTLINFDGGGKYFSVFATLFQFIWMAILMLCLAGSIHIFRREDKTLNVFGLSLLGAILFVSIFETNSRYLYCFVPVFIIVAGLGLSAGHCLCQRLIGKNRH